MSAPMRSAVYEPVRCVVCGHAEADAIADADEIRAEVEWLWEFHGRRLEPETPVSHLTDRVAFSEPHPFRLVACRECGLVYRSPGERTHTVVDIYSGECTSTTVHRSLFEAQLPSYRAQARRLLGALGRRGTVLEVGSYVGGFLAAARELGVTAEGVDINPATNAMTRDLGFIVHDGDFLETPTERKFDAVAIWNTFDQLPDPRRAVFRAWDLLRPGGILAIRVPNGLVYRRLRSRASRRGGRMARMVLAHNNLLAFPYRFGFTPRSLGKLLGAVGFVDPRFHGDVLAKVSDAFTRPWARLEEKLVTRAVRPVARRRVNRAPWFEVYATRPEH